MDNTKKIIIASAVIAVIVGVVVFNSLSTQKDFGTPEEFRDAYNNSFVDGAKIINVQKERRGGVTYYLNNGMIIGAFTDELNGRITMLLIMCDNNDFSVKEFETTCKKTLFSINKVHILEFDKIEKFVQSSEGYFHYGDFIGGVNLNKLYEDDDDFLSNKFSCIFVNPASE